VAVCLAILFFGLPEPLSVPAALATSILTLRAFLAGPKLRRWLSYSARALVILLALIAIPAGVPYVAVSSRSPDGTMWAELYETDKFVDRHFQVRLTRYWLGIIPIRRVVYRSPDEGQRGGERLLWSRDGRHVVLLGLHLFAIPEACLSSGETLYLLVDARTGATASNASQTSGYPRFSVNDIERTDFDIDRTPGIWDSRRHRCVPSHTTQPTRREGSRDILLKPRVQGH
jgi:hypothetical protein